MRPRSVLVRLTVNGRPVEVAVAPSRTLLEALRYELDLVGTKQGCDEGDCGACTVQLDGEPVLSCLTLAVQADGRRVGTVEGLGAGGPRAQALLDAFERASAVQCGFCTPGILMSADRLLRDAPAEVSREQVSEALSGHLCRCTGYRKILDAVVEASDACAGEEGET